MSGSLFFSGTAILHSLQGMSKFPWDIRKEISKMVRPAWMTLNEATTVRYCEGLWAMYWMKFLLFPIDSSRFRSFLFATLISFNMCKLESKSDGQPVQADPELGGFVGPGDREMMRDVTKCYKCVQLRVRLEKLSGHWSSTESTTNRKPWHQLWDSFIDWSSTFCVRLSDFSQFCAVS